MKGDTIRSKILNFLEGWSTDRDPVGGSAVELGLCVVLEMVEVKTLEDRKELFRTLCEVFSMHGAHVVSAITAELSPLIPEMMTQPDMHDLIEGLRAELSLSFLAEERPAMQKKLIRIDRAISPDAPMGMRIAA